jgi:hypothetical protein
MTELGTDLDVDGTDRRTLLAQLAIRPLLRPVGNANPPAGCAPTS